MGETRFEYATEIQKLASGLVERGIPFTFGKLSDGFQIVVGNRLWDAVCHSGSYGHENCLIEILGSISNRDGDVEGWLTAEDILKRL